MTITPEGSRFLMGHDSDFGKIPNRLHRKADMKSDSLKATDAFSAARSTGPRVTLEGMEDKIVAKHFFVAGDALHKLGHPVKQLGPFDLLTICLLEMANGFTVIGKSAPAAPENFDREKGQVLAYEDAIRQLWPLEGYALRERLEAQAQAQAKAKQAEAERVAALHNPIPPTVGRVVLVRHPDWSGKDLAALVTYVHSDHCINVAAHDPNGNPFSVTSVCYDAAPSIAPLLSWRWMDYQLSQAVAINQAAVDRILNRNSGTQTAPRADVGCAENFGPKPGDLRQVTHI